MSNLDFQGPMTQMPESANIRAPSASQSFEQNAKFFDQMENMFRQKAIEERKQEVKEKAKEKGADIGLRSAERGRAPELKEGDTLYDRVFNDQAVDAWKSQTRLQAYRKAEEAFEQNKFDPEGFDKQLNEYREGIEKELPDEMVPDFRQTLARQRRRFLPDIEKNTLKRQKEQNLNALQQELEKRTSIMLEETKNKPEQKISEIKGGLNKSLDILAGYGPSNGSFEIAGVKYIGNEIEKAKENGNKEKVKRLKKKADEENNVRAVSGNGAIQDLTELKSVYNQHKYQIGRSLVLERFKRQGSVQEMKEYREEFLENARVNQEGEEAKEDLSPDTGVGLIPTEQRSDIASDMQEIIDERLDILEERSSAGNDFIEEKIDQLKEGVEISSDDEDDIEKAFTILRQTNPIEAQNLRQDYERAKEVKNEIRKFSRKPMTEIKQEKQRVQNILKTNQEKPEKFLMMKRDALNQLMEDRRGDDAVTRMSKRNSRIQTINPGNFGALIELRRIQEENIGTTGPMSEKEFDRLAENSNQSREILERMREQKQSMVSQLKRSKKQMRAVMKGTNASPSDAIMSDAAAEQFGGYLKNTNASNKVEFLEMLREAYGKQTKNAIKKIAPEAPGFAYAAGLAEKGQDLRAKKIIKGRERRENQTVPMPSNDRMVVEFNNEIGGALRHMPSTRETVFDAVKSYYASELSEISEEQRKEIQAKGDANIIQRDIFKESVEKALGKKGDQGGIISFRDQKIVLPTNTTEKNFRRKLNYLASDKPEKKEELLREVSVGGGLPKRVGITNDLEKGFVNFDSDFLADESVKLVSSGEGKYKLKTGERWVKGTGQGGDFEIDFKKLDRIVDESDIPKEEPFFEFLPEDEEGEDDNTITFQLDAGNAEEELEVAEERAERGKEKLKEVIGQIPTGPREPGKFQKGANRIVEEVIIPQVNQNSPDAASVKKEAYKNAKKRYGQLLENSGFNDLSKNVKKEMDRVIKQIEETSEERSETFYDRLENFQESVGLD